MLLLLDMQNLLFILCQQCLLKTLSSVVQAGITAFHDYVQSLDLHYQMSSHAKCHKHLLKLMC